MARRSRRPPPTVSNDSSDEFARLLAERDDRRFAAIAEGDRVEGTVVSIGSASLFVDIGQRSEGVISLDDVRPDDLGRLRVGDRGEFLVSRISADGIELAWALTAHKLDSSRIEDAKRSGIPVEAKVTGENRGGFTVELGGTRGFVPFSQMELGAAKPSEEYLGRTFRFRVIEVRGRDVVLSRAALLREEQERERRAALERLEPGLELEAEIVRIERFGIFVDVGAGLHALVPISELAWSGQDQVKAALEPGAFVNVKILEIQTGDQRPKISASMRQVTDDPWLTVDGRFAEGQVVPGRVARIAPFGAFVEIAPGIEGLLHLSEMSAEREIRSPSEVVRIGDTLDVSIASIDAAGRRIGLSIRGIPDAPLDAETRARYVGPVDPEAGGGVLGEALRRALRDKKR